MTDGIESMDCEIEIRNKNQIATCLRDYLTYKLISHSSSISKAHCEAAGSQQEAKKSSVATNTDHPTLLASASNNLLPPPTRPEHNAVLTLDVSPPPADHLSPTNSFTACHDLHLTLKPSLIMACLSARALATNRADMCKSSEWMMFRSSRTVMGDRWDKFRANRVEARCLDRERERS